MKRYFYLLLAAISIQMCFVSCMKDDEEVEYSSTCYISSFSLGSLRKANWAKGSAGQDSVFYTTFASTAFPMSVDQRNLVIENKDSLPYGTEVNRLLTTCVFDRVLVHRPENIQGLEPEDTAWVAFDKKDSIDFSTPRHFRVFAADGYSYRTYTVKVNVHKQNPDSMVWKRDSLGVFNTGATANRQMAASNGHLVVMNELQDGSMQCLMRAMQGGEWTSQTATGAEGADVSTLKEHDGHLYMSTHDGRIITSTDGTAWQPFMSGRSDLVLAGLSQDYLYATCSEGVIRTSLTSEDWKSEAMDEDANLLPLTNIGMALMQQTNGNSRLVMMGLRHGQTRTWSKVWYQGRTEEQAGWVYYTVAKPCPALAQMNMMPYDDGLIVLGGSSADGKHTAMDHIYYSYDNGVTWRAHETATVNGKLQAEACQARLITAAVGADNHLWVLVDNQLWRGRVNRMGFQNDKD